MYLTTEKQRPARNAGLSSSRGRGGATESGGVLDAAQGIDWRVGTLCAVRLQSPISVDLYKAIRFDVNKALRYI